ncbi:MAG: DUF354 domain-containing protein [Candidatus Helarchaeota archaeon]|nr:DUF354 domain-containing protein [Candidatus Helarchaeota archaeon]
MTPKEVWLLGSIQRYLKDKGYDIVITARNYDKNIELLKLRGFNFNPIGEHGGGTLEGKLKASTERILELTNFILSLSSKPDVCISLCSVEASRVAFGLGIPHICFDDAPHATAVNKLVIPLSKFIISPKCVPKNKFFKFGAQAEDIIQFDGIDEVAWVTDFKPDDSILNELDLKKERRLIILRPKESQAAYLLNKSKNQNLAVRIIKFILEKFKDSQIVVFTRYPSQFKLLNDEFKDQIIIPSKAIDGPNLISFSDLVISGGATMEREAALLGIPAISYFPLTLDIEIFLKEREFPIWHLKNFEEVLKLIEKILKEPEKYKKNTRSLLKKLENPKLILENLLKKMGINP